MVVLAIVCVAPAHPAATMQWARLWGHVGAHNEYIEKNRLQLPTLRIVQIR